MISSSLYSHVPWCLFINHGTCWCHNVRKVLAAAPDPTAAANSWSCEGAGAQEVPSLVDIWGYTIYTCRHGYDIPYIYIYININTYIYFTCIKCVWESVYNMCVYEYAYVCVYVSTQAYSQNWWRDLMDMFGWERRRIQLFVPVMDVFCR